MSCQNYGNVWFFIVNYKKIFLTLFAVPAGLLYTPC